MSRKRKINQPNRYSDGSVSQPYLQTYKEQKALFDAIHKYGIHDIKRMKEAVPDCSEEQIRKFIDRKMITIHNKLRKNHDESFIEQWIKLANNRVAYNPYRKPTDYSTLLSKYFYLVSRLEDHPTPEESHGIDYSEIYRFFAQILSGEPPTVLSAASASKIDQLLHTVAQCLTEEMLCEEEKTIMFHLRFCRGANAKQEKATSSQHTSNVEELAATSSQHLSNTDEEITSSHDRSNTATSSQHINSMKQHEEVTQLIKNIHKNKEMPAEKLLETLLSFTGMNPVSLDPSVCKQKVKILSRPS